MGEDGIEMVNRVIVRYSRSALHTVIQWPLKAGGNDRRLGSLL